MSATTGKRKPFFEKIGHVLLQCLIVALSGAVCSAAHDSVATRCLDCHVGIPLAMRPLAFHDDIHLICQGCHVQSHATTAASHPVNVVPSMKLPADMHLDTAGKLTCITCHEFHAGWQQRPPRYAFLLRRPPGKQFCSYCHRTL